MTGKKTALIILDGWGHGDKTKSDVIYQANTPFIDSLYTKYPNSQLLTDGKNVGLPKGQMGNSEVGHLNIVAGRIVYQDLAKINKDITSKTLDKNTILLDAIKKANSKNKPIHIVDTNPVVHKILSDNLQKSAMYSGNIGGVGLRYCPSIEDKIVRFSDKDGHQLFLEPEWFNSNQIYVNGFSTSMPKHVQEIVEGLPDLLRLHEFVLVLNPDLKQDHK